MPNTEQSIQETGGIPEIELVMEVSGMTMTPVDKTLSVDNMAADAKATGDAIANTNAVLYTESEKIAAIENWTGEDIPLYAAEENEDPAPSIERAIAGIDAKKATDIQMSSTDQTTIADAVSGLAGDIETLEDRIDGVDEKTGADILYSDAEGATETIKEHVDALESDVVTSVNGQKGDVEVSEVDFAKNLRASSFVTQTSEGTYIQRTTGGSASIGDGNAVLTKLLGNSVHAGFVPEEKSCDYINADPESASDCTIDWDVFKSYITVSGTYTLTYNGSSWSSDIANYGITIIGTPAEGDMIIIDYVKEVRGSISVASPSAFISTGWNLFSSTLGYAKVVKYSDTLGYKVSGAYTRLEFSATLNGARQTITPDATTKIFQIPSDGYVWVTGGDGNTTAIYPTWNDWKNGYPGDFMAYYKTEINLADAMSAYFPYGMCKVGDTADEINITAGTVIRRIERIEYSAANLVAVQGYNVPYEYDENYIYYVDSAAVAQTYSINGNYAAYDHGIEWFTVETEVPVTAFTSYSPDLKNKLERDVLTISQQALTAEEKTQVRNNAGAAAKTDVDEVNTKITDLFKHVYYKFSVSSIAASATRNVTAQEFGAEAPAGYKPLGYYRFSSGSVNLAVTAIVATATGTGTMMTLRNRATSAQSNKTAAIGIIYVKTGFGI